MWIILSCESEKINSCAMLCSVMGWERGTIAYEISSVDALYLTSTTFTNSIPSLQQHQFYVHINSLDMFNPVSKLEIPYTTGKYDSPVPHATLHGEDDSTRLEQRQRKSSNPLLTAAMARNPNSQPPNRLSLESNSSRHASKRAKT